MVMFLGGFPWSSPNAAVESQYAQFRKGWATWLEKHPDGVIRDEKGGQPHLQKMFDAEHLGSPALKRLVLKLLHPNPDMRISVHDALYGTTMRGVDCCTPDSYEPAPSIDASALTRSKSAKMIVQKKHNHLPPKEHKTPKILQHRFDMGEGWN
jgi:protein-serine/threonine kinase